MNKKTLFFSLLSSAIMVSCSTDAAYDRLLESDGIDLSIKVANGLNLPFGSTDKIMLTELMDTAKVKQLHATPDGQFYLAENGNIDATTFGVTAPKFSIKPNINGASFELLATDLPQSVQDILNSLNTSGLLDEYFNRPLGDIQGISGEIQTEVKCEGLAFNEGSEFNIRINDVTDGLVELASVELKEPVELKLEIQINGLPCKNQSYGLTLSDFSLELPDFIKATKQDGTITATKAAGSNSATLSYSVDITGLDFSKPLQNVNGTIECSGTASVKGELSSASIFIDANDLMVVKDGSSYKIQLVNNISVDPTFTEMNMELYKVTGRFNPTINSSTSNINIDLGEDMDFLKGNDVEINLKDPSIHIDINNPCPVRVWADFTLKASNGKMVKFSKVDLSDPSGSKGIDLNKSNTTEGDFTTFLSPIPENVEVKVEPYADSENTYTYTLGEEQEVFGSYSVNLPLSFNSISFTYDKRAENIWGDDREDVVNKVTAIQNASLDLTIENAIPMDLELSITGINYATGKEDESVVNCTVSNVIKGGSIAKPSVNSVQATLDISSTYKLGDLIIRVKGEGSNCEFNANQYVRIKSSNIKLNDGIVIDLD